MSNFYNTPLRLSEIFDGKKLDNCSLTQSITKHLELIIMTRFGECRSDPSFGCEIWDRDFELIASENLWEEKIRLSLKKSIEKHEHRLSNIQPTVTIDEIKRDRLFKQTTEIRKRVTISLKGIIKKTGENFSFSIDLLLSPLSRD